MSVPRLFGRQVRGVVFDLDGTLINTTVNFGLMRRRIIAELVARGIPLSELDGGRTTADDLDRAARYLEANGRGYDIPDMHRAIGGIMNMTEIERVTATTSIEGAGECLARIKEAGLMVGILTRGSREYAVAALRYACLDLWTVPMICRDDFPEEEAKPNGKAMERIAEMMGLKAEDCILVGDHEMDLSCACSVSAGFIGVLSGTFGMNDWIRAKCPVIIDSVRSLPRLLLEDHESCRLDERS